MRITMRRNDREITDEQEIAFLFYILVFCIDFMSEKGTKFNKDDVEEVKMEDIIKLEKIFLDYENKLKKVINIFT